MSKKDKTTKAKTKGKKAAKAKAPKLVTEVPAIDLHPHLEHLDRVGKALAIVRDKSQPKGARKKAAAFLDEARAATLDRMAAKALAEEIDRADAARVEAFNETVGRQTGHYITSKAESDAIDERIKAKREVPAYDPESLHPDEVGELDLTPAPVAQEAEVIETEHGREFAVGAPAEPGSGGLMMPAEDANPDFDLNGNGQYKVWNPAAKAERGYTRVTTYIDCLEDKSRLTEWKMREVLVGAGLDVLKSGEATDGTLIAEATKLYLAHSTALRKIGKREAKGELDLGQFGLLRNEADKALRDGLNVLTERAMEFAGANEKRERGTDLHKLTEELDRGELGDIDNEAIAAALIESGKLTHADLADLRAYKAKMLELGIRHVYIEKRVVLDGLKVAGTLDRGSYYKLPGATRATKLVADLKTGRIDYSAGKIGMQLALYAQGEGYDRKGDTSARERLGLSKSVALLIHLPAGEARCEVYPVDLTLATKGLKLAAEVRTWRNEGKRVYDLKDGALHAVVDAPTDKA
jgi:hypothetical protein